MRAGCDIASGGYTALTVVGFTLKWDTSLQTCRHDRWQWLLCPKRKQTKCYAKSSCMAVKLDWWPDVCSSLSGKKYRVYTIQDGEWAEPAHFKTLYPKRASWEEKNHSVHKRVKARRILFGNKEFLTIICSVSVKIPWDWLVTKLFGTNDINKCIALCEPHKSQCRRLI